MNRFLMGLCLSASILFTDGPHAATMAGKDVSRLQSDWQVEAFLRNNQFPTGECIMRGRYDNGLEITFKGRDSQLTALRVKDLDYKSGPAVNGFIGLGLGKTSFGLQSRSIRGQVDASLLTVTAPAQKIMDVDAYRIRIGKEDLFFSTEGFDKGYQKLLSCIGFSEPSVPVMKVVSEPRLLPTDFARTQAQKQKEMNKAVLGEVTDHKQDSAPEMPSEPIELVMVQPLANDEPSPLLPELQDVADMASKDENPVTAAADIEPVKSPQWNARSGQTLSEVLAAWASTAGVQPNFNLAQDPVIKDDFVHDGSIEEAVQKLLSTTLEEGTFETAMSDEPVKEITPAKQSEREEQPHLSAGGAPYNWRALQGTNLRSVLRRWSAREGVRLIWDADQQFLIRQTVKEKTDYADAVIQLLSQYSDQTTRPVGILNVDPDTGQRALIISIEKIS